MNPNDLRTMLAAGYRQALALSHDAAQAESLLRDAWRSTLRAGEPSLPILRRTLRTHFLDGVRTSERVAIETGIFEDVPVESDVEELGRATYDASPTEVREALGALRPEEREALSLEVVDGITGSELGRILGRPRGTVLTWVFQSKQAVAARLEAGEGVTLDEHLRDAWGEARPPDALVQELVAAVADAPPPTPELPSEPWAQAYTPPLPRQKRSVWPKLLLLVVLLGAGITYGPGLLERQGILVPEVPALPEVSEIVGAIEALPALGGPPPIAVELSGIHTREDTPDASGGDFDAIAKAVRGAAGFTPQRPSRLDAAGLLVTGARATTLAGEPAAQFLLTDARGRLWTLVQALDGPVMREKPKGDWVIEEFAVRLWSERGYVNGLVGPVPVIPGQDTEEDGEQEGETP